MTRKEKEKEGDDNKRDRKYIYKYIYISTILKKMGQLVNTTGCSAVCVTLTHANVCFLHHCRHFDPSLLAATSTTGTRYRAGTGAVERGVAIVPVSGTNDDDDDDDDVLTP